MFPRMSPTQIIEAIKGLPPEQRADVIRFTQQYEPIRELSPEELGELADRLLAARTPEEAEAIKKKP